METTNHTIPVQYHLVNHGKIYNNPPYLLANTDRSLPIFRELIGKPEFKVCDEPVFFHLKLTLSGHVGRFDVLDRDESPLAECLVVRRGESLQVWQNILERCRQLNRAGLAPLSELVTRPPSTEVWVGMIIYNSYNALSVVEQESMDVMVFGLARAFIEIRDQCQSGSLTNN